MAKEQLLDANVTESVKIIDKFNTDLATSIQQMLSPVYNSRYGDFFTTTIFGIPLGQIIAAFSVFVIFLLFRKLFTNVIAVFVQKLAHKTETFYDDKVIAALKKPISFVFIIIGLNLFFIISFLETDFSKRVLESMLVFTIFWAIIDVSKALRGLIYEATAKINKDLSKEMGNFILTIINIIIGGIGLGAMLQIWGINVTALIASLGIGGLAFALAAKDTVSNLFASFSLLADKSIAIGEWIKVGSTEGVVEEIGMRTTKIRSFQKSLITLPNQIIANNPIENFSRRGIRRIKMRIGLTYSTSSKQMNDIVNEIKYMLTSHDHISKDDTLLVNFESFGDSALNIFIYTFTNTASWDRYMDIREDIHLKIMNIVEKNNSSFAFPSQSIYMESTTTKAKNPNKYN